MLDLKGNSFEDHQDTIDLVFKSDHFGKMRSLYMNHLPDYLVKKKA